MSKKTKFELNFRQRRFVEAYLGPAAGNGTKAARLAGYFGNEAALAVTAARLLRIAKIQKFLSPRHVSSDLIMNREEMEATLSRMARSDESPGVRLRAMEQLAKIQGLHLERHQVESREIDVRKSAIRADLRAILERPDVVEDVLALGQKITRGAPELPEAAEGPC